MNRRGFLGVFGGLPVVVAFLKIGHSARAHDLVVAAPEPQAETITLRDEHRRVAKMRDWFDGPAIGYVVADTDTGQHVFALVRNSPTPLYVQVQAAEPLRLGDMVKWAS